MDCWAGAAAVAAVAAGVTAAAVAWGVGATELAASRAAEAKDEEKRVGASRAAAVKGVVR